MVSVAPTAMLSITNGANDKIMASTVLKDELAGMRAAPLFVQDDQDDELLVPAARCDEWQKRSWASLTASQRRKWRTCAQMRRLARPA